MGTVKQPLLATVLAAAMTLGAASAIHAEPATQPGAAAHSTGAANFGAPTNTGAAAGSRFAANTAPTASPGSPASPRSTASAESTASAGATANTRPDTDTATRATRWQALQKALFPGRAFQDGAGVVKLDAPLRALDAALVPVSIDLSGVKPIKGVYVVIDDNPSPLAAHFTFGPKADPHSLKLRVRVDQYTDIHAIAESQDGHLFVATRFVKASGGCSAPAGPDDANTLADIGRMKLHLIGDFTAGKPEQAVLMVRHPNFNGMQMNQITRYYTPPRFIRTIDATYEGGSIFHLDSDISMSTDPVITFGFVPQAKGQLKVVVRDSKNATFDQSFDVPQTPSVAGAPGA